MMKWSKHGFTCLAARGHDPPFGISIFGDISKNPGPSNQALDLKFRGNQHYKVPNLHVQQLSQQRISYSGSKLLSLSSLRKRRCIDSNSAFFAEDLQDI